MYTSPALSCPQLAPTSLFSGGIPAVRFRPVHANPLGTISVHFAEAPLIQFGGPASAIEFGGRVSAIEFGGEATYSRSAPTTVGSQLDVLA